MDYNFFTPNMEENEKALALEKYGTDEGSGKSLPFSNLDKVLAEDLKKKEEDKE